MMSGEGVERERGCVGWGGVGGCCVHGFCGCACAAVGRSEIFKRAKGALDGLLTDGEAKTRSLPQSLRGRLLTALVQPWCRGALGSRPLEDLLGLPATRLFASAHAARGIRDPAPSLALPCLYHVPCVTHAFAGPTELLGDPARGELSALLVGGHGGSRRLLQRRWILDCATRRAHWASMTSRWAPSRRSNRTN